MSRKGKDEFRRLYTVSDPRTHPKGYTEYKVTAQFISKKNPEDIKEVVVWRRYSDFRRLHGDLAFTHRNLFRRLEEFPAFPRAQVFGRFEAAVIEERRKGAEDMLRFTVHIPALNNSPQLKEFFRVRGRPGGRWGPPSPPPPALPWSRGPLPAPRPL
uniref:Sorting nexin-15 n=1 Tax=Ornithorhynchus anatinus TaxID=9258 RepID=A0A6I8NPH7_ORNAN